MKDTEPENSMSPPFVSGRAEELDMVTRIAASAIDIDLISFLLLYGGKMY